MQPRQIAEVWPGESNLDLEVELLWHEIPGKNLKNIILLIVKKMFTFKK